MVGSESKEIGRQGLASLRAVQAMIESGFYSGCSGVSSRVMYSDLYF